MVVDGGAAGSSGDGTSDAHRLARKLPATWGQETTWSDTALRTDDMAVSTAAFFDSRSLDVEESLDPSVNDVADSGSAMYRRTSLMLMLILALCFATLVAILLSWFWLLRKHLSIRRINHRRDQRIFQTVLLTKSTSVTGLHLGEEHERSDSKAKDETCVVHKSITVLSQPEKQESGDERRSKSVSTRSTPENSPCVADSGLGQTGGSMLRPETPGGMEKDDSQCDVTEDTMHRVLMRPVAWYVPLNDVAKIRHSTLMADSGLDVSSPSKDISQPCAAVGISPIGYDTRTCEHENVSCIREDSEKASDDCGPWTLECLDTDQQGKITDCEHVACDNNNVSLPEGSEGFTGRPSNEGTSWEQREERPVMFMVVNAAAND